MRIKRKAKASYTVEAALIVPAALFLILFSVKTGVSLHAGVKEASCHYEKVQQFDAVSEVKMIRRWKKLMEE